MKTLWLKIAVIALAIVVAIVVAGKFTSSDSEAPLLPPAAEPEIQPKAKQRTFSEQVEEDKKRFLAEPQPIEEKAGTTDQSQRIERPEELDVPVLSLEERKKQYEQKMAEDTQASAKPSQPAVLYFKPLDEIEQVEAERLLNVAVPGRSIGRLPIATDYKLMVEPCRQIISKWPESWYAYRAKQLLADMPERLRPRYNITEEELDLSAFTKPRAGTEPFKAEDMPR